MKLPVVSGKEALTKAGFVVIRQRGSHVRLEKLSDGDIIKIVASGNQRTIGNSSAGCMGGIPGDGEDIFQIRIIPA